MLTKDKSQSMVDSKVTEVKKAIDLRTDNQADKYSGSQSGGNKKSGRGPMYTTEKSKNYVSP